MKPIQPRLSFVLTAILLSAAAPGTPTSSLACSAPNRQERALIQAVLTNNDGEAIRLLDLGVSPNVTVKKSSLTEYSDARTGPLLISAVGLGDVKIIKALLSHGANAHITYRGETPFGVAVSSNKYPVVAALFEKGADVNAQELGETPLYTSVSNALNGEGGSSDLGIIRLLIEHGADVNARSTESNRTPLMCAVDYLVSSPNQVKVVRALLAAHPDLELKDSFGSTVLRTAERQGENEIVALLRGAGAKEFSPFPPIIVKKAAYRVTDLGLGQANAINSRGDVVGIVSQGKTDFDGQVLGRAFLWSRGHLRTLPGLKGPSSIAQSVNDKGEIVGQADYARTSTASVYTQHAVLWRDGVVQDLHPRTGWASKDARNPSGAVSINNAGLVALSVNTDCFLWKEGKWRDLKTDNVRIKPTPKGVGLWESGTPTALNESEQVAVNLIASGGHQAGVWASGKMRILPPPRPTQKAGDGHIINDPENYGASGINDNGEIIGDTAGSEPVCWSHGKITFLPNLYGYGANKFFMNAFSINNRSQIVGMVTDVPGLHQEAHAVLWQGNDVRDLNTLIPANSGWVLEEARGINEAGQIVGRGMLGGQQHAFLLTPLNPNTEKAPAVSRF